MRGIGVAKLPAILNTFYLYSTRTTKTQLQYMSYTPPLNAEALMKAVKRFKIFILISMLFALFTIGSIIICPNFWAGNIIWSFGSFLTLVSVVTNRYFDIKKTANKRNQLIDIENIPEITKPIIKKWLTIEKYVSYLWILGTILLVISRWINR